MVALGTVSCPQDALVSGDRQCHIKLCGRRLSVELRLCHGCSFSWLRCTCQRILLDSGRKIATSCGYIGGSASSSRHPSFGKSRVRKQGVAQWATQKKNGASVPAWLMVSSAQVRNTLWHHCTLGHMIGIVAVSLHVCTLLGNILTMHATTCYPHDACVAQCSPNVNTS